MLKGLRASRFVILHGLVHLTQYDSCKFVNEIVLLVCLVTNGVIRLSNI